MEPLELELLELELLELELLEVEPLLVLPLDVEPEEVLPLLVLPLDVEPLLVLPLDVEPLLVLLSPMLGETAPPQAAASCEARRIRNSFEASGRCMRRAKANIGPGRRCDSADVFIGSPCAMLRRVGRARHVRSLIRGERSEPTALWSHPAGASGLPAAC